MLLALMEFLRTIDDSEDFKSIDWRLLELTNILSAVK